MSDVPKLKTPVEIHIVNGCLLTNRPEVFSKNFEFPATSSVDGLTRVSPNCKPKPPRPMTTEKWAETLKAWLAGDDGLLETLNEDEIKKWDFELFHMTIAEPPDEMTAEDWTDAVEDWLGGDDHGN